MSLILNGDNGVTFNDSSLQGAAASPYVLKNRIINGDMRIDQRNAGASVTVNANSAFYPIDRFFGAGQSSDGVFTLQQNTSVPTGQGFNYSIKATITTADSSIGATQQYYIGQNIEGYNVADLMYGTANAQTVTLSFWVNCSVTGTFSGCFMNDASDRSYPFTYTISSANTWEEKTITIAGDTTGTWLKTNGSGLSVQWSLGAGSSRSGTANTWAAARYHGATGATTLISTLNATFYITGVQLEVGSTATPFERRLYGQELALCQRYFQLCQSGVGRWASTSASSAIVSPFYVGSMRTGPTASLQGTVKVENYVGADPTVSSITSIANAHPNGSEYVNLNLTGGTGTTVIGYAAQMYVTSSTSGVALSAEL